MSLKKHCMRGFAIGYVIAGISLSVAAGYLATNFILSVLSGSKEVTLINQTRQQLDMAAEQLIFALDDADRDDIYEPPRTSDGINNYQSPTAVESGGLLSALGEDDRPSTPAVDNWRSPIVYCPWHYGPVAWTPAGSYFEVNTTVENLNPSEVIYALISLGPDKTRATSCQDARNKQVRQDDIVRVVTFSEAQKTLLRTESCEDGSSAFYNPATGRFECEGDGAPPGISDVELCNSLGMVYNGEACVFAGSAGVERQGFSHIPLDIQAASGFYRSIVLKDGYLAIGMADSDVATGYKHKVTVLSRSRGGDNGNTWVQPRVVQAGDMLAARQDVRMGYRVGIFGSSQFEGDSLRSPQLFTVNPDPSDANVYVYRYRMFGGEFTNGFIATVGEYASGLVPTKDALNAANFLNTGQTFSGTGASLTNQPVSFDMWENKTGDGNGLSYFVIGMPQALSTRGRVMVYRFDEDTIHAPVFSGEMQGTAMGLPSQARLGAEVAIGKNWVVARSMPASLGVSSHGKMFVYKRNGDSYIGVAPQILDRPTDSTTSYPLNLQNMAISGDWLAVGEPMDNTYGTNAGMVAMYRLNKSSDVWELNKKLYSPYRSSNTALNANAYFGWDLDLDKKLLSVMEPGYYTHAEKGTWVSDAYGLAYLYLHFGGEWQPRNVYARHHEPATGNVNSSLTRRISGPVAVDGNSGEVGFFMSFSGTRFGSDLTAGGDPFWYAAVFGPFTGTPKTFFNDDEDDLRETCPSPDPNPNAGYPDGPFRGEYEGDEPGPDGDNLDEFGLTRSAGNCFDRYNGASQTWH